MKNFPTYLLLLLLAVLFGACGGTARKIGPVELLSFTQRGLSGADITLSVANRSNRTLCVREAEVDFYYETAPVGRATLRGEIVSHRRTVDTCATRWRFEVDNPLMLLLLEQRLLTRRYDGLTVDYRFRVESGAFRKTFSEKMVPLSDFLATFAGTTSEPL